MRPLFYSGRSIRNPIASCVLPPLHPHGGSHAVSPRTFLHFRIGGPAKALWPSLGGARPHPPMFSGSHPHAKRSSQPLMHVLISCSRSQVAARLDSGSHDISAPAEILARAIKIRPQRAIFVHTKCPGAVDLRDRDRRTGWPPRAFRAESAARAVGSQFEISRRRQAWPQIALAAIYRAWNRGGLSGNGCWRARALSRASASSARCFWLCLGGRTSGLRSLWQAGSF
jgi:hypothetical protein